MWRMIAFAGALALLSIPARAEETYQRVVEVFSGNQTVAGEPLVFPSENPGLRALVVSMAPGEATGWHRHGVPLFAYILEGEVTVTYDGVGERVFREGDGVLEALTIRHRGVNTNDGVTRILAVFFTGDGGALTEPAEPPAE